MSPLDDASFPEHLQEEILRRWAEDPLRKLTAPLWLSALVTTGLIVLAFIAAAAVS